MERLQSSEELIKECIKDLYLDPRNLIRKWSKITNQTCQIRMAYPGQHLASLITGLKGTGTAARGDDLSDGSGIKSCSRADQLSECNACSAKVLVWQDACPICNSKDINIKTDSHWIFSIKSEDELDLLLNKVPRIITILFDRETPETPNIRLRVWVIDVRQKYTKDFFTDYFMNNYLKKTNPDPCNLHPLKFDFFMMEPKLIFHADINIGKRFVEIRHWDVQHPRPERMPLSILTVPEIIFIFQEELRAGMKMDDISDRFPYVPTDKIRKLKMRPKVLKKYKSKYRRRENVRSKKHTNSAQGRRKQEEKDMKNVQGVMLASMFKL